MDVKEVLEHIYDKKIIAIVRGVEKKYIVETAKAILDGGIDCLEITINHDKPIEETIDSITLLKDRFGNKLFLGAGTVLTPEEVDQVVKAGAEFILSPDMNVEVIHRTKELGKISIPGAYSATEIVTAHREGADIVKVFPAGLLGTSYIKALRGPLPHIPFSAVGGVNLENVTDFLRSGCCSVGIGGNLVDVKAIRNGEFYKLTETAKQYVNKVNNINS